MPGFALTVKLLPSLNVPIHGAVVPLPNVKVKLVEPPALIVALPVKVPFDNGLTVTVTGEVAGLDSQAKLVCQL